MHLKLLALHCICNLSSVAQTALEGRVDDAISIKIADTVPSRDSPGIEPNFASFAFEERSFYMYFGTPNNPNKLSHNLINAITEKTKTRPNIRVGGTSLDESQYDPTQVEAIKIPEGEENQGIPSNMTFGPSYFDVFATFSEANFIIDIPMKKDNLENSERFANDAYNKIGAARIASFEIGNEPNNYDRNITNYVKQWQDWSADILKILGLKTDESIYQAVCLGSETGATKFPGGTPEDWKIPDYFEKGLKNISSRISSVSMHYYQTKANSNSDLQHDLMNHTAVVKGSAFVKDAITYLNNNLSTPIPLVLGEVGSALGNISNDDPLEAVLGSALWQVDFFLYSMSIGVKKIHWQSGLTFPFALWNPTYTNGNETLPASIHPAFYGQMFAAEFIGNAENVRVHHFDLNLPFLSAYAAYDNGRLGRVAVANLQLWSASDTQRRPNKTVTLNIGAKAKSVEVKKLTSPKGGTAHVENITWGGMQWIAVNDGVGVQVLNDSLMLPVNQAKVEFNVSACEAVMLFVQY